MERLIRGSQLGALAIAIESFDQPIAEKLRHIIGPRDWEVMKQAKDTEWYPIEVASRVQRLIFEAKGSPETGYALVRQAGSHMADASMRSFMRLVVKLMTPAMLANRWPTFWRKCYNFGVMKSATDEIAQGRFSLLLHDVDGYHHLGPLAEGFISTVLASMGMPKARVEETLCPRDQSTASDYRIDIAF